MKDKDYIVINGVKHSIRKNKSDGNCDICSLKELCDELSHSNSFCMAYTVYNDNDVHFEIDEGISENNIRTIAKDESIVYGACFADSSESVANNREEGFYDGFIRCMKFLGILI